MTKALGQFGEQLAARYLRKRGYRVLHRGYRASGCEIDLIVEKAGEVVFVEVKTRRSILAGFPEESVTLLKRRHIERAASAWLQQNRPQEVPWRVDVVSIQVADGEVPEILHFEGV